MDSIPGLGRLPGVGNGKPCKYSCLEKSMNRGPSQAIVHRVRQIIGHDRATDTHRDTINLIIIKGKGSLVHAVFLLQLDAREWALGLEHFLNKKLRGCIT